MSGMVHKRDFVSAMYDARGWRKKVAKMTDEQVVAIFLREQKKADEAKSKEDSNDGDIPF